MTFSLAQYVGTFEHDSPEWHAARAQGIGASEIAAILGLSPWESHFSLWHRKAGIVGPAPGNELQQWGHYLEPAIAKRFAAERPDWRVQRTGTWRSRMRPWQFANPDRLGFTRLAHARRAGVVRVPVEVKWSPHSDGYGDGPEDVPVYYRSQLLWQMDVLGSPFGYLVALVGSEYREFRIEYDPVDVEVLRDAGAQFMASLETGIPPDIDDSGHTYRVLREMHPDIEDRDVEIPRPLAQEWRGSRGNLAAAKAWAQRMNNELLAAMGAARRAVMKDGEPVARRQPGARGSIALHEIKPPKNPKTIKEAVTT